VNLNSHRIRRQRWEIRVAPGQDAFAIRRDLRALVETDLEGVFDEAFEEAAPAGHMLRLPRLAVNLRLPVTQGLRGLRDGLLTSLREQLRPNRIGYRAVENSSKVDAPSTNGNPYEALLRFLRTGSPPSLDGPGNSSRDDSDRWRALAAKERSRLARHLALDPETPDFLFRLFQLLEADALPEFFSHLAKQPELAPNRRLFELAETLLRCGPVSPHRRSGLLATATFLAGALKRGSVYPTPTPPSPGQEPVRPGAPVSTLAAGARTRAPDSVPRSGAAPPRFDILLDFLRAGRMLGREPVSLHELKTTALIERARLLEHLLETREPSAFLVRLFQLLPSRAAIDFGRELRLQMGATLRSPSLELADLMLQTKTPALNHRARLATAAAALAETLRASKEPPPQEEDRATAPLADPLAQPTPAAGTDSEFEGLQELLYYLQTGLLPWAIAPLPPVEVIATFRAAAASERATFCRRLALIPAPPEFLFRLLQLTGVVDAAGFIHQLAEEPELCDRIPLLRLSGILVQSESLFANSAAGFLVTAGLVAAAIDEPSAAAEPSREAVAHPSPPPGAPPVKVFPPPIEALIRYLHGGSIEISDFQSGSDLRVAAREDCPLLLTRLRSEPLSPEMVFRIASLLPADATAELMNDLALRPELSASAAPLAFAERLLRSPSLFADSTAVARVVAALYAGTVEGLSISPTDFASDRSAWAADSIPVDETPATSSDEPLVELSQTPPGRGSNAPTTIELKTDPTGDAPFSVENAGLVLLHPYLPRLLERTGVWSSGASRLSSRLLPRAAGLLHLLATGRLEVYEFELTFIKVLLGLDPATPLCVGQGWLRAADVVEAEHLIEAAISHWTVLKKTSIGGFRTAFLERRGLLDTAAGQWRLRVERLGRDILLDFLTWTLSIVKLPWMRQPIMTEW